MKYKLAIKSILAISLLFSLACTKERPEELPDGQQLGVFSKEEISTASMQIGGGSDIHGLSPDTVTFLRVETVSGNEKLKFMFKDLNFVGRLSTPYEVRYVLNGDSIVAVKIQSKDEPLAAEDKEVATSVGNNYHIPLFKYKAEYGNLVRSRNDLGEETSILRFEKASFSSASHLRIETTLEARIPIQDIDILSSPKHLVKAEVVNKEFLYRRTIQDSPNEFDNSFIGISSSLEIVKFVFRRDKVEVVRAGALIERGSGNSMVDNEVLLSVPVTRYKKPIYKDLNGVTLPIPKFEVVDYRDPQAVAELDWAKSEVLASSSPLSYYGAGQCFAAKTQEEVLNVDKNLEKGDLNFTVVSTYASNPSVDCAGFYRSGYFDTVQTNFSFKERVSFKEYVKGNEEPALKVPYTAQKLMGFGLFTYSKDAPNELGTIGVDHTKIPLPAVFDIKEGKKIRYVLAGLPEDSPRERAAIIQATKEVVADWNTAFRKALASSPLERQGDVIELFIEGDGPGEITKASLGDLDRNYIYYVNKVSRYGILGLGGSHANPRSGRVEAASVFVYGGNMKVYADYVRRQAKIKREYNQIMQVRAMPQSEDLNNEVIEANLSSSAQPVGELDSILSSPSHENLIVRNLQTNLARRAYRLESYRTTMSPMRLGARSLEAMEGMTPKALALLETLQEAATNGELQNAALVESIYGDKVLKHMGAPTPYHRQQMEAESARYRVNQQVRKNLEKANFCVYDASEAGTSSLVNALANTEDLMDPIDLLVKMYKPTLAHEIGHNLGLRHNFIASVDHKNHKFDENDTSKRDYSSVMDYNPNDHLTYDGLGPYDVAAIRAAYTGLVELSKEGVARVDSKKVVADRFIQVEDYREALGLDSWNKLSEDVVKRIPLKPYKFCSDEDAGLYPTCNRHDTGIGPIEIVNNIIQEYRSTYAFRNFRQDRERFPYWATGGYVGRLFYDFIRIRQFLEEGLFLAITGKPQEDYIPHLQAAINGMQFFQSVIASPEIFADSSEDDRYIGIQAQVRKPDGSIGVEQIPVELKRTEDKLFGSDAETLAVRGIELDKMIALIALTERNFGFRRYEQISMRVSYPEVEKMLLLEEGETAADTPTMSFLQALLANELPALAPNPKTGIPFVLPNSIATNATDSVRVYAILGAIAFLDVNALEEKDNLSSFFRVFSSFKAPDAITHVAGLNDLLSSQTVLKYYTDVSSESSGAIIRSMDGIAQVHRESKRLAPLVNEWMGLRLQGHAADSAEVVERVTKINEVLMGLPATVRNKDFNTVADLLLSVFSIAQQLHDLEKRVGMADGMSRLEFEALLERQSNAVSSVARQEPLLGLMLNLLPDFSENFRQSSRVMQKGQIERHYGLMLSNIRLLNQVFYSSHPEYRR